MRAIIESILGVYTAVETEIYIDATTTYSRVADGIAGVDWPWVIGAVAFLLCLYSFFRLLGVLLRG